MLPVRLKDDRGKPIRSASLEGQRGLLVGSFPARRLSYWAPPFLDLLRSPEMAINGGTSGGSEENVWDGTGGGDTGTPDWTLTGDPPFTESAAAMHSGTNGLDTGFAVDGDKLKFAQGGAFDPNLYSALEMWINTQSRGAASDIELRFKNGVNSARLLVSSYITWTIGSWVLVVIPIADFVSPSGQLTFEMKFKGANQRHYVDDIRLVSPAGVGPTAYRVQPDEGLIAEVSSLRVTLVDTAGAWSHDDFGARTGGLAAGLLLRHWDPVTSKVWYSQNVLDNVDLFTLWDAANSVSFFDAGTLVTFDLHLPHPIRLSDTDVLEMLVRDDLSGLLRLQARAVGGVARPWEAEQLDADPDRGIL